MAKIREDENMCLKILKQTNKQTPSGVFLLLFLKADDFENDIFYLFAIFFRFLGFLIICGNYYDNSTINLEHLTISNTFRALTSYGLIQKIKMTNQVYNIVSIIIFILFLINFLLDFRIFVEVKKRNIFQKIPILKIQVFLQNLTFLFFPYIIEFLSFIFYIQFFGDKFIIKKNSKEFINIIIMILNTVLIITFNIQGFFINISINNPIDEKNDKIKLNYSVKKIICISLLQNIIMIECLGLYLNNNNLIKYNTTLRVLVLLIFIIFFSIHIKVLIIKRKQIILLIFYQFFVFFLYSLK